MQTPARIRRTQWLRSPAVVLFTLAAASQAAPKQAPRFRSAFALPLAPERLAWWSPLGQRNDLHAVRGTADGQRLWAVGTMGTIVSLNGRAVALEDSGTVADLHDIWVAAENDVWVVGDHGTILHGDGKRWSAVRSGTKRALYAIWGRSANDLWIGGRDGTVLHRVGNRWRVVRAPTQGPIVSVAGCDQDAVCMVTMAGNLPAIDTTNRPCRAPNDCPLDEPSEPAGNRILRWSAGRWSAIYPRDSLGIEPTRMTWAGTALWLANGPSLSIIGVGAGGERTRSLQAAQPKGAARIQINGLYSRGELDGWLVGEKCTEATGTGGYPCDGAIWRLDGGDPVLRQEVAAPRLFAVWAWSKTGAVAVGERGTILRFDGDLWTAVSKPATVADLRGVFTASGSGGRTQIGPVVWQASSDAAEAREVTLTLPGASKVTWGLLKHGGAVANPRRSEADVWLVGDCELLRARDGGWVGYVTHLCEAQAATRKILGLDSGEVWIARGNTECAYDPTWQARWDGREWVSVRSPSARQMDLWASGSNDVWLVGGRDVVRWDGRTLAAAPPMPGLEREDEIKSIWGADPNDVWVAAISGRGIKVARWTGKGWSAMTSFAVELVAPFLPSDAWDLGRPWPPDLGAWGQVALWGTSATDVWLAGPNGIVLRFDGASWRRVATPTRQPLLGLGGTSAEVVVVGASGTILRVAPHPSAPAGAGKASAH